MNLILLILWALAVAGAGFVGYGLVISVGAWMLMGVRGGWLPIADLAGVPVLLYPLVAAIPVAGVMALLMFLHAVLVHPNRVGRGWSVGAALMVTVFQCGVAGLIAVRWYAMPLNFHSEMDRSYIALFGVGVLLVNVVLVCAEEWLLSPRGQISGAAE